MAEATTSNSVSSALAKVKKQGNLAALNSKEVGDVLQSMRAQIEMAIPKHLSPDRMIAMASTLITKNQNLAKCSAPSFIGAVMQASILGFRPVESLGQCYFVPYGNQIQFQIGYRGFIDLARRSGQILDLYAECVYERDDFKYTLWLERNIHHVPAEGDRGKFTHVYAVVRYKDGGYNFMVLTRYEVEKLRMRSPMQKSVPSGAWATDYEEMAKAKAIKRLGKYMPLSDEFMNALATDEGVITDKALSNNHEGLLIEEIEPIVEAEEVPAGVDPKTGEVTTPPAEEKKATASPGKTTPPPAGKAAESGGQTGMF